MITLSEDFKSLKDHRRSTSRYGEASPGVAANVNDILN